MRNAAICFFIIGLLGFSKITAQSLHDVLITEIMSDPSPSVGSPEVEYLEIYNRTGRSISLKGWKLAMATRTVLLPDSLLLPLSYIVLCHKNSLGAVPGNRQWIGLNTFSLSNDGAQLALYNQQNQLIHTVSYRDDFWPTATRNGGYALEMIDTSQPCLERENWAVSIAQKGGTPGQINSVAGILSNKNLPLVEQLNVISDIELAVVFDKRLDSISAVKGAVIELPGRKIVKRRLDSPGFRNLTLTLDAALLPGNAYTLSVSNLADCAGNILRAAKLEVGLPVPADPGDVVINEILFNPREGGVDFVEIYNPTSKYLSIRDWSIGNMKNGQADIVKSITKDAVTIPPNSFLAVTTQPSIVAQQYPSVKSRRFLMIPEMPAFTNEQGGVLVKDHTGRVMDQFLYNEDMHYTLFNVFKGVSLERIDHRRASDEADNWHSAASTVGYGTPGYANSQAYSVESADDFKLIPEIFTPNMDGVDDVASIEYAGLQTGLSATINIFDTGGRLVKRLVKNQLIGTNGAISWDGIDDRQALVKTGHYLIVIDTFDLNGNKRQYKKKVVAATER